MTTLDILMAGAPREIIEMNAAMARNIGRPKVLEAFREVEGLLGKKAFSDGERHAVAAHLIAFLIFREPDLDIANGTAATIAVGGMDYAEKLRSVLANVGAAGHA